MTYYPVTLREHRTDEGAYIPSQEKIKEECLKIRKTWNKRERKLRLVTVNPHADVLRTSANARRRSIKNGII